MWITDPGCWPWVLFLMCCMTFHIPLEVLWSLYMLISNIELIWVCIWMAVMSDDVKLTCVQLLVGMFLLMSSMDLILWA